YPSATGRATAIGIVADPKARAGLTAGAENIAAKATAHPAIVATIGRFIGPLERRRAALVEARFIASSACPLSRRPYGFGLAVSEASGAIALVTCVLCRGFLPREGPCQTPKSVGDLGRLPRWLADYCTVAALRAPLTFGSRL